MDKDDIVGFIDKLKQMEKDLTEGVEDMSFMTELNKVITALSTEFQENSFKNNPGMEIKVKKLHGDAIIPTYAKFGDAGMDLTITEQKYDTDEQVSYGFGIAMEIPLGYVGLVFPRSSIRNYGLSLANCVGVIDSGYRGEIQATFNKIDGISSIKYNVGDKAAQIIILPIPTIKCVESDTLSDTDRGSGGHGHTGN